MNDAVTTTAQDTPGPLPSRIALFLCPTLVMNLRAGEGAHNPTSSAIGLATALAAGSPPTSGRDRMSDFFDRIRPA